mmetsp:Transcript_14130/g.33995  ORF Transcript_14130/g.33995 Transcript_14130/m.33995 type:complete len:981 (-) Transcript_14130:865-3807(-)
MQRWPVLLLLRSTMGQEQQQQRQQQQQTNLTPAQRILQGPAAIQKQQIASNFDGGSFEPTPENLISKARVVVATDLGIQDPSVLSDDDDGINQFLWIRPLADKPLGRIDYLAAGRFFNLRGTFPNLDWRAHDFRIDVNHPLTVRVTVRPVGTMAKQLRLRNQIVPPNGKIWRGPPESISMTFDPTNGKVVKLCSEFVIDRQVGNTNGLAGVKAAMTVAGVPPSDFEIYPAPIVIDKFFGRPLEPLDDPTTFLAPFPETVMITLAKGLIFANFGMDDTSLLSENFQFLSSTVGPVGKSRFLTSYAADQFGDFRSDYQFSNYRVDPYDPYRVWCDIKLIGSGLEGPPLAYSFTFDDDGFCTRINTAVLDNSIGNTGGLANIEGIRYSLGEGSSDISTRPLPVALGRLRKALLSPITKIAADDFVLKPVEKDEKETPAITKADAAVARKKIAAKTKKKTRGIKSTKDTNPLAAQPTAQPPVVPTVTDTTSDPKKPLLDLPSFEFPPIKLPSIQNSPQREPVPKTKTGSTEQQQKLEALKKKQEDAKARAASIEKARQQKIAVKRKSDDERRRNMEEARKRQEEQRITLAKSNAEERRRKAAEAKARAERQKADLPLKEPSPPRPSLSLSLPRPSFQISKVPKTKSKKSKPMSMPVPPGPSISFPRPSIPIPRKQATAPKGVPTVVAWKVKSDGGISGQIFGSPTFKEGQRFKTSSISKGVIGNGNVVTTESGSRYFLSEKTATEMKKEIKFSPPKELLDARPGATIQLSRQAKEDAKKKAIEELNKAKSGVTLSLSAFFGSENRSKDTSSTGKSKNLRKNIQSTQLSPKISQKIKPKSPRSAPAPPSNPSLKKRPTFSLSELFGTNGPSTTKPKPAVAKSPKGIEPKPEARPKAARTVVVKKKVKPVSPKKMDVSPSALKTAPSGVPTIANWRRNKDRSITGFIKGSKNFSEGEKVTTSPIANGVIRRGELVTTGSGSKYFLQ